MPCEADDTRTDTRAEYTDQKAEQTMATIENDPVSLARARRANLRATAWRAPNLDADVAARVELAEHCQTLASAEDVPRSELIALKKKIETRRAALKARAVAGAREGAAALLDDDDEDTEDGELLRALTTLDKKLAPAAGHLDAWPTVDPGGDERFDAAERSTIATLTADLVANGATRLDAADRARRTVRDCRARPEDLDVDTERAKRAAAR